MTWEDAISPKKIIYILTSVVIGISAPQGFVKVGCDPDVPHYKYGAMIIFKE